MSDPKNSESCEVQIQKQCKKSQAYKYQYPDPNGLTLIDTMVCDIYSEDLLIMIYNLRQNLRKFTTDHPDYSTVIIEKQFRQFAFASIESAIMMYFLDQQKHVVSIHPSEKLKIRFGLPVVEQKYKKKYDQNKYICKHNFQEYSRLNKPLCIIPKKNIKDIADSFMQCVAYIILSDSVPCQLEK